MAMTAGGALSELIDYDYLLPIRIKVKDGLFKRDLFDGEDIALGGTSTKLASGQTVGDAIDALKWFDVRRNITGTVGDSSYGLVKIRPSDDGSRCVIIFERERIPRDLDPGYGTALTDDTERDEDDDDASDVTIAATMAMAA